MRLAASNFTDLVSDFKEGGPIAVEMVNLCASEGRPDSFCNDLFASTLED